MCAALYGWSSGILMQWTVPFIIYRVSEQGELVEVFRATDAKMAKYWLSYIAQHADVLCRTPLHVKHSHESNYPEYWCHKGEDEDPRYCEDEWLLLAKQRSFTGRYPNQEGDAGHPDGRAREEKKCLY